MLIEHILGSGSRTVRIVGPGVRVIYRSHGENETLAAIDNGVPKYRTILPFIDSVHLIKGSLKRISVVREN
jgi:hypothetical protein